MVVLSVVSVCFLIEVSLIVTELCIAVNLLYSFMIGLEAGVEISGYTDADS